MHWGGVSLCLCCRGGFGGRGKRGREGGGGGGGWRRDWEDWGELRFYLARSGGGRDIEGFIVR